MVNLDYVWVLAILHCLTMVPHAACVVPASLGCIAIVGVVSVMCSPVMLVVAVIL